MFVSKRELRVPRCAIQGRRVQHGGARYPIEMKARVEQPAPAQPASGNEISSAVEIAHFVGWIVERIAQHQQLPTPGQQLVERPEGFVSTCSPGDIP